MRRTSAPDLLAALDHRLAAAAAALGLPPATGATVADRAGAGLDALVDAAREGGDDAVWLLLTAATATLPTSEQVLATRRRLALEPTDAVAAALLAQATDTAGLALELELVDGVVVDVDFTARHDVHTGIHRVIRETVPRWPAVTGVAWTDRATALRRLTPRERDRVFRFAEEETAEPDAVSDTATPGATSGPAATGTTDDGPETLVVPWRATVVLADVATGAPSERLMALARFSGSTVVVIGYDLIPITSAHLRPAIDAVNLGQHLSVVKHAHRVAAISAASRAEFAGFAAALAAQGLPGPVVREVALTETPPPGNPVRSARGPRPVVLLPGTREPHKNQLAALYAAERLWRDGLDFEVRMMGGRGWTDEHLVAIQDRLRRARRPFTPLGRVSEDQLWQEYTDADLTVFLSLHEGYGLPVAESLGCGTPVLTSDFGSQAEIAAGGGCRTVDPDDDRAVTAALRALLTDPAALAELRAEAARRPGRGWDAYAAELWSFVTEGTA